MASQILKLLRIKKENNNQVFSGSHKGAAVFDESADPLGKLFDFSKSHGFLGLNGHTDPLQISVDVVKAGNLGGLPPEAGRYLP